MAKPSCFKILLTALTISTCIGSEAFRSASFIFSNASCRGSFMALFIGPSKAFSRLSI